MQFLYRQVLPVLPKNEPLGSRFGIATVVYELMLEFLDMNTW
jgi:hypothetical protein